MVGSLLLRGMAVGAVAAVLAFAFALAFGEPQIDRAIAFEEQMSQAESVAHEHAEGAAQAHSHGDEEEVVSRSTQAGLGLFVGLVAYGSAVGGLFALVFAFVYGRIGSLGPRGVAALLALAAFVAIILVPGLKYPANPPSVGLGETIGQRTQLYFVMLAISIGTMAASVGLARQLWSSLGGWNASLVAGLAFVAIVGLAGFALPTVNEVPAQFSATLLWSFRTASFGMQVVIWSAIGLLFGALTERSVRSTGRLALGSATR